jgi:prepilin signal peptidase PulO-like enzyme (type II secretory pathway)
MNQKTTYELLLLTVIALFIAPQVARSGLITQALPFVLYLILGVWLTVLMKNISIPG